jgi:hypothetical protein
MSLFVSLVLPKIPQILFADVPLYKSSENGLLFAIFKNLPLVSGRKNAMSPVLMESLRSSGVPTEGFCVITLRDT